MTHSALDGPAALQAPLATTDPDVRRVVEVDQPLLSRPAEGGAVGVGRTEIGVPGVEVRVEVQHGERAVSLGLDA